MSISACSAENDHSLSFDKSVKWLLSKYYELVKDDSETKVTKLNQMIWFFKKRPNYICDYEWNCILYSFYLMIHVLGVDFGVMFSESEKYCFIPIFHIKFAISFSSISFDQHVEYTMKFLDSFKLQLISLYQENQDISSIIEYYYKPIIIVSKKCINSNNFDLLIPKLVSIVENINLKNMNRTLLLFLYDIITLLVEENRIHTEKVLLIIKDVFVSSQRYPYFLLRDFFPLFFRIFLKSSSFFKTIDGFFEIITKTFYSFAQELEIEVGSMFSSNESLGFLEIVPSGHNQTILLSSLSRILISFENTSSHSLMKDSIQRLSSFFFNPNNSPLSYRCFFDSMSTICSSARRILHCFKVTEIYVLGKTIKRERIKVLFKKQNFGDSNENICDEKLYSFFIEDTILENDSSSRIQRFVTKQYDVFCSFTKMTRPFFIFLHQFLLLDSVDKSNQSNDHYQSTLMLIVRTWINCIVILSSRITACDIMISENNLQIYDGIQKRTGLISSFYTYFQFIESCPPRFYSSISEVITRTLLTHHHMGKLSFLFMEIISRSYGSNEDSKFYPYLMNPLFGVFFKNIKLFNSINHHKADEHYRWLMLILRINSFHTNLSPKNCFVKIISIHSIPNISSLFALLRFSPNQTVIVKTLQAIIDTEKDLRIYQMLLSERLKKGTKSKRELFDEINETSKSISAQVFLEFFCGGTDLKIFQSYENVFSYSLSSNDSEMIKKASLLVCHLIQAGLDPETGKFIKNSCILPKWFDSLFYATPEVSRVILDSIPKYVHHYLQNIFDQKERDFDIKSEEPGLDLLAILEIILNRISFVDDEIPHVYALVYQSIKFVCSNISVDSKRIIPVLTSSINLLCVLFSSKSIRSKLIEFCSFMNSQFAYSFSQGHSNAYFICLIQIGGSMRSKTSKMILKVANNFVSLVKSLGPSPAVIEKAISEILCFPSTQSGLLSKLSGISIVLKYFPKSLKLYHIKSFLVQLTDPAKIEDVLYSKLNVFLKDYLSYQTITGKSDFLLMIYDTICPLAIHIRSILMKRIYKLRISLAISSMKELYTNNKVLLFQRISLVFLCGANFKIDVNQDMIKSVISMLSEQGSDIPLYDKLSRFLQLLISIIKNPDALNEFSKDDYFVSQMLNYICNSLTINFIPVLYLAKKCVKFMRTHYRGSLRFSQAIYDYCLTPERIFIPFGPQPERHSFYRRLTRLIADKTPSHLIDILSDSIIEYSKKSDNDKMRFFTHYVNFIKHLSVREIMEHRPIKERLFSIKNGRMIFDTISRVFIELSTHQEIPFQTQLLIKYIKFFSFYPKESIRFFINEKNYDSNRFLDSMVCSSKNPILLDELTSTLMVMPEYDLTILDLLLSLSENKKVFAYQNFKSLMNNVFYELCSKNNNQITLCEFPVSYIYKIAYLFLNNHSKSVCHNWIIDFLNVFHHPAMLCSDFPFLFLKVLSNSIISYSDAADILLQLIGLKSSIDLFMFQLIVIHFIGYLLGSGNDYLSLILSLIISLSSENKYHPLVLRIGLNLGCLIKINDEITDLLYSLIIISLDMTEPVLLKYSIKLSIIFVKNSLLNAQKIKKIIIKLFQYPGILKSPQKKHLAKFLLCLINNGFDSSVWSFSISLFDEIDNLDSLINIGEFLLEVPIAINYLSFSLVQKIYLKLLEMKIDIPPNNDFLFNKIFKLLFNYDRIYTDHDTKNYIILIILKFFPSFINMVSEDIELSENIVLFVYSFGEFNIPISEFISLNPSQYYLIAIACKTFSNEELIGIQAQIINYLEFPFNNDKIVSVYILELITNRLFSPSLDYVFGSLSWQLLEKYLFKLGSKNVYYGLKFAYFYILHHQKVIVDLNSVLLYLMNGFFECVVSSRKIQHIDQLINDMISIIFFCRNRESVLLRFSKRILVDSRMYEQNIFYLLNSIESHPFPDQVIGNFLEHLPKLSKLIPFKTIEKVISKVEKWKTFSNICNIVYRIVAAKQASPSDRLSIVEKIKTYLPPEKPDIVFYLVSNIPVSYWEDDYICIIISLFSDQNRFWQPVLALTHYISDVSSEFFTTAIWKYINNENQYVFVNLFKKSCQKMKKLSNSQVISGLIKAFNLTKMPLPSETVQHFTLKIGEFGTVSGFINEISVLQDFLLPHSVNDTVYALLMKNLNTKESCAIALTFLSEYESAQVVYNSMFSDRIIFKRMERINSLFIGFLNGFAEGSDEIKQFQNPYVFESLNKILSIDKSQIATEPNKLIGLLDNIQYLMNDYVKKQKKLSFGNKEIVAVILIITNHVRRFINKEPISLIKLDELKSCMNGAILAFAKRKIHSVLDLEIGSARYFSNENPIMFMEESIESSFSVLSGVSSRGLVGISLSQSNRYLSGFMEQVKSNSFNPMNLGNFSAFCFNLFSLQLTSELLSVSLNAYCTLFLKYCHDSVLLRHSSSARIMTLLRFLFKNESFSYNCGDYSEVFSEPYHDIWRFWLMQIIQLSCYPKFFNITYPLLLQMIYRSTLYGEKLGIKSLIDLKQYHFKNSSPSIQFFMMDKLEKFGLAVFNQNIPEFELQKSLHTILAETQKMESSEIRKLNLMEIRMKTPTTLFEKAVHQLTLSELECINEFEGIAHSIKSLPPEQLMCHIKDLTNSSLTIEEHIEYIMNALVDINRHLPFVFPVRFEKSPQIYIIRVHDEICYLGPNLVILHATSSVSPRQSFLIQKTGRDNGFHHSVITLTNILFFFEKILRENYSSHIRSVVFESSHGFEVGNQLMLVPFPSDIVTMEQIFKTSVMMRSQEWLRKFSDSNGITRDGYESIKQFKHESLKKSVLDEISKKTSSNVRIGLFRSYAATSLVRHMFNAQYPSLNTVAFCKNPIITPLLQIDFDFLPGGEEEDPNRISTAFRLSPNIIYANGPTGLGELTLTIASVSQAIIHKLECVRAFLEVYSCDRLPPDSTLTQIIEKRDTYINNIIDFSPPVGPNVTPEICEKWLKGIEDLIERAQDPEIQPQKAIPWF